MSAERASSEELGAFWGKRLPEVPGISSREEQAFQTKTGCYESVRFAADDGEGLSARFISPRLMEPEAVVLELHDAGRGMRGWHHLGRWLALGCAVLSFERRAWSEDLTEGFSLEDPAPEHLALVQQIRDAASALLLAGALVPDAPVLVFGEGLGAGLGLAVGALAERVGHAPSALALLNPLPGDARTVLAAPAPEGPSASIVSWERQHDPEGRWADELFWALSFAEPEAFAPWLTSPVLLGTSLLDAASPPAAQERIAEALGNLVCHKTYPRWAHERVNAFEDAAFSFFQPYIAS